ncbi:MAG: sigma-70 family RNA polymerase sigma factor, partial [Bacteroidetes bacterium]|nr:sigma-70 family RNA polymerase sigma factor [Bacteroidota bacterium]
MPTRATTAASPQQAQHRPPIPHRGYQNEAEALRARDPDAIDRLVQEHHDLVYKFVFRFVSDAESARNLVQETFYQALRSLDGFRGGSQVSTWLCSIAKHVAIAHLRKAKRRRAVN